MEILACVKIFNHPKPLNLEHKGIDEDGNANGAGEDVVVRVVC